MHLFFFVRNMEQAVTALSSPAGDANRKSAQLSRLETPSNCRLVDLADSD